MCIPRRFRARNWRDSEALDSVSETTKRLRQCPRGRDAPGSGKASALPGQACPGSGWQLLGISSRGCCCTHPHSRFSTRLQPTPILAWLPPPHQSNLDLDWGLGGLGAGVQVWPPELGEENQRNRMQGGGPRTRYSGCEVPALARVSLLQGMKNTSASAR